MQLQAGSKIAVNRMVGYYTGTCYSGVYKKVGRYVIKVSIDNETIYVDGEAGGNYTRFANHSCDPNTQLVPLRCSGALILALVTTRPIQPLEFISWDYGSSYEYIQTCLCGSSKCRDKDKYLPTIMAMHPGINLIFPTLKL